MKLRVGTDCSGIEAPIQALKKLNIPFKHEFSSDIDKNVIKSIKANYYPRIIFGDKEGPFPEGDITKRKIKDVPDIDLYVCGFPCQPFSKAGKREGFEDTRGTVFFHCLEVIKKKKPKYFILENVRGLLSNDEGKTFQTIWTEIQKLKGYYVDWSLLNTKDFGIPQNRERVWFVGTRVPRFQWPKHKPLERLSKYIDYSDTHKEEMSPNMKKHIHKFKNTDAVFVDSCFISILQYTSQNKYCSCLNAQGQLWNLKMHRYANIKELLMLQGFPSKFKQVVSNRQLKKQIGNSMSVNVLTELFKSLLST